MRLFGWWMLHLAALVSLLVCVAATWDFFFCKQPGIRLWSSNGLQAGGAMRQIAVSRKYILFESVIIAPGAQPNSGSEWRFADFSFQRRFTRVGRALTSNFLAPGYATLLWIPIWAVILASLIWPAVWFTYWWRTSPRPRVGHCPSCSYDLTGNVSGVCPECGSEIKKPAA